MANVIQGQLVCSDKRFGVVVSRFNEFISGKLLEGCMDGLVRHGGREDDVTVVWAPGSFEIPMLAKRMAESGKYDAVITLGAVIRGGTPHFDYVASEAAKGVGQAGLQTGVPVIFGVITTDTLEQAIERAGSKAGNKGWEAAVGAIEMADLNKKLMD